MTYEEKLKNTSLFIEGKKEALLENYEEAESLFKKCLAADPNHAASMFELANISLLRAAGIRQMQISLWRDIPDNGNYGYV